MTTFKFTFHILVLVLMLSTTSHAKTISLVTGEDFKPYIDPTLQNGGMTSEIIRQTFKKMGYEIKITVRPWKRGQSETLKGMFFGTYPYSKNKERLKKYNYSIPLVEIEKVFFIRKDSGIKFEVDEDLKGLKVCRPIGWNLTEIQKFIDKELITLKQPQTMAACFRMLNKGRVDLVNTDVYAGWKSINESIGSTENFTTLKKALATQGLYLIVSKTYPDGGKILEEFNQTLDQLKQKGIVEKIIQDHLN